MASIKKRVSEENSRTHDKYITLLEKYKGTHKESVLRHMLGGAGISSMEAFMLYGITRLSDVIFRIKKDGVLISKEPQKYKSKNGRVVHFDKYYLTTEEHRR